MLNSYSTESKQLFCQSIDSFNIFNSFKEQYSNMANIFEHGLLSSHEDMCIQTLYCAYTCTRPDITWYFYVVGYPGMATV